MPDYNVNIKADASEAVAAASATAQGLRGINDEAARYEAKLRQVALAAKAAEQAERSVAAARREAADESSRYAKTLQSMAEAGGKPKGTSAEDAELLAKSASLQGKIAASQAARAAADKDVLSGVRILSAADVAAATASVAATGKWTSAKTDLLKSLKELGREFPILGTVGRLALNPIALAVAVATAGFAKLRKGIESVEDSLTTAKWEGWSGSVLEATDQTKKLKTEMDAFATAASKAEKRAEAVMNVFKARQSAEERRDNAAREMELARAGDNPAKKFEVEERYARRAQQREAAGRQFELSVARGSLANQRIIAGALDQEIGDRERKQQTLGDPENLKEAIEALEGNLKETKLERGMKLDKKEQIEDKLWAFRTTPEEQRLNTLPGEIEATYIQEGMMTGAKRKLQGRLTAAERNKQELDKLRQTRSALGDQIRDGAIALPAQAAIAGIDAVESRNVGRMESLTRAAKASDEARREANRLAEEIVSSVESGKVVLTTSFQKLAELRAFQEQMTSRAKGARQW